MTGWDTSNVTTMGSMFQNVDNVTSLDLTGFDTSSVTSFSSMFNGSGSLITADISGFNIGSLTTGLSMFFLATAWTDSQYDDALVAWAAQAPSIQNNVPISFGNAKYQPSSAAARLVLTGTYNWSITDGGEA